MPSDPDATAAAVAALLSRGCGFSEETDLVYSAGALDDPADPQRSVLRRGVTFGALFVLVLLIIAGVYAIWLFKS
jgi:hypothetical protein